MSHIIYISEYLKKQQLDGCMDGYLIYKKTPHGIFLSLDRESITCTFHLRHK